MAAANGGVAIEAHLAEKQESTLLHRRCLRDPNIVVPNGNRFMIIGQVGIVIFFFGGGARARSVGRRKESVEAVMEALLIFVSFFLPSLAHSAPSSIKYSTRPFPHSVRAYSRTPIQHSLSPQCSMSQYLRRNSRSTMSERRKRVLIYGNSDPMMNELRRGGGKTTVTCYSW